MKTGPTRAFLTIYDYGTGGVWAVIKARSREEIVKKYPLLDVVDQRPEWMTEERYRRYEARSFDIDDEPPEWLKTMPR